VTVGDATTTHASGFTGLYEVSYKQALVH
jgi:hypothetical protein